MFFIVNKNVYSIRVFGVHTPSPENCVGKCINIRGFVDNIRKHRLKYLEKCRVISFNCYIVN